MLELTDESNEGGQLNWIKLKVQEIKLRVVKI